MSLISVPDVAEGSWLVGPQPSITKRLDSLDGVAFLGVDFGTSTTVVSLISRGDSGRAITVRPLTISQPSLHGGVVRDEIVNSVKNQLYRASQMNLSHQKQPSKRSIDF